MTRRWKRCGFGLISLSLYSHRPSCGSGGKLSAQDAEVGHDMLLASSRALKAGREVDVLERRKSRAEVWTEVAPGTAVLVGVPPREPTTSPHTVPASGTLSPRLLDVGELGEGPRPSVGDTTVLLARGEDREVADLHIVPVARIVASAINISAGTVLQQADEGLSTRTVTLGESRVSRAMRESWAISPETGVSDDIVDSAGSPYAKRLRLPFPA